LEKVMDERRVKNTMMKEGHGENILTSERD
jgi:hypothetical protein